MRCWGGSPPTWLPPRRGGGCRRRGKGPVIRHARRHGHPGGRVCHSEELSDEESQAIVRLLRLHSGKRDSQAVHRIGEPYVDRPERWVVRGSGFFTAFRMTGGRAASVILRSRATKNPKAIARLLRLHSGKRDSQSVHGIGESWVDRPER